MLVENPVYDPWGGVISDARMMARAHRAFVKDAPRREGLDWPMPRVERFRWAFVLKEKISAAHIGRHFEREPFQEKCDTVFRSKLRKTKDLEHFPRFGEELWSLIRSV